MSWCLLPQYVDKFKKGLKDREIDPVKLAGMTSMERRAFFEKYVGEENAQQINALFESKLLLNNQKAGYISWAKKIVGMSPQTKTDLISRIERMDKILDPVEESQFLQDLASTRLRVDITQEEAKQIFDLSKKSKELREAIKEDMPNGSKERIDYGVANALLKEYVAKLKSDAKTITFKEQPFRKVAEIALNTIPNLSQTIRTAYDNSVWLRQAIAVLTTPRYTRIWLKNFPKSFVDLGRELKGHDAMLAIKADVYSRQNALNGKYAADSSGYGLGVTSEEVYSSELPAKIPVLGRLFKGTQTMFNGAALRLRADVADLEIQAAETLGINVMDKKNAAAIGNMVTSLTGRGSIGGAEGFLRKIFWAPRMYAAQFNRLTAHVFDPKANAYTKSRAAKNLASRLAVYTLIYSLANMIDKDSTDFEGHPGKIKIWGKWVDWSGGDAGWVNLFMKMSKKTIGYYTGAEAKFGEKTASEELWAFAEGKLSPTLGLVKSVVNGKFYGGEKVTTKGLFFEAFTPISYQTFLQLSKDPTAGNILGLMLLEMHGANVQSWLDNNSKTDLIPTNTVIKDDNFISMVQVYAKALNTDPETALNRIFTGQKIIQVSGGGIIVVARQDVADSEAFKKKWVRENGGSVKNMKEVKLDHTIPNKLGGSETPDNWKIVPTSTWQSYTKVENSLIKAVKDKKIGLKDAQKLIVEFKKIDDSTKREKRGKEIIDLYK